MRDDNSACGPKPCETTQVTIIGVGPVGLYAWLRDGCSLSDGFDFGYSLMAAHGANLCAAARVQRDAAAAHVPLTVAEIKHDGELAFYAGMLTLIRPDPVRRMAWAGMAGGRVRHPPRARPPGRCPPSPSRRLMHTSRPTDRSKLSNLGANHV